MNEPVSPRLFFVDELCLTCPMYIFDEAKSLWRRSRNGETPKAGDRIVVNMLNEMVVTSAEGDLLTHRKLKSKEKPMWTGSYPDSMPVDTARVRLRTDFDRYSGDDVVDPVVIEVGKEPVRVFKMG